jgi:tetratricopeptide (TPR) repeat protein
MMQGQKARCLAAGLYLLLAGCATDVRVMVSELEQESNAIELGDTPFYSQVTDQCGPSALATILNVSGIDVAPEALKSQVYIPGREGSLQIELLAATRGFKRIPYQIEPDAAALLDELRAGRPVLVLQNLGGKIRPVWHYAVVVGFLPAKKQFVLRSGDQKRYMVSASRFVRSWQRAEYWGIVALRPGELPSSANAARFLRSVAAIEDVGDAATAEVSFSSATERWPDNTLAWLGLGNSHYAQGELDMAEAAYRRLLKLESDHPVGLNNLAQVLADKGCFEEAADVLDSALKAADFNKEMVDIIMQTRSEIGERYSTAQCP